MSTARTSDAGIDVMPPDAIVAKDWSSFLYAGELAKLIQGYWNARGFTVRVRVANSEQKICKVHGIAVIRSDLLRGLPRSIDATAPADADASATPPSAERTNS